MNATLPSTHPTPEEQFGRRVAARLSAGNLELPHELSERLRAARVQAVARRKSVRQLRAAPVVVSNGGTAAFVAGWGTRLGSFLPLVALVAALVVITVIQDDNRANELAEVDSALLTDDLPPAAYTDPGFVQFLRAETQSAR
ncbi:MAG: DUF3619 family protein [Variovorax sp.]